MSSFILVSELLQILCAASSMQMYAYYSSCVIESVLFTIHLSKEMQSLAAIVKVQYTHYAQTCL